MATQLYQFTTDSGKPVIVEIETSVPAGGRPVAGGNRLEDAKHSIRDLLSIVPDILTPVYDGLVNQISAPKEIKLEIGFKLSGELGVIIAETQTEGNLKVTATWSK